MKPIFPYLTVREMAKALDQTLPSVAIRGPLALHGIHFRFNHFIEVTGMDGTILSSIRIRTDPRVDPHPEFTVHGSVARDLRNTLKKYLSDDTVEFMGVGGPDEIRLGLNFGPPVVIPVMPEKYPDYEKLLPPVGTYRTTCMVRLVDLFDACHAMQSQSLDLRLIPGKFENTGMMTVYPTGCDLPVKVLDASPALEPRAEVTLGRQNLLAVLRSIRASDDWATVCFPLRNVSGVQFLGESELHRTLIKP